MVEKDRGRPLSASVLAVIVVVSALATVLRTHMRGVLVSDDWVEARYLLPLGIPRARRWAWAQVLRVVLDGTRVAFELWDGSFERLPDGGQGPGAGRLSFCSTPSDGASTSRFSTRPAGGEVDEVAGLCLRGHRCGARGVS